jgi:hypothetical protein
MEKDKKMKRFKIFMSRDGAQIVVNFTPQGKVYLEGMGITTNDVIENVVESYKDRTSIWPDKFVIRGNYAEFDKDFVETLDEDINDYFREVELDPKWDSDDL